MATNETQGRSESVVFNTVRSSIILIIYSYFNLRCRIKASSLQDKTEGEYGILMNNYQQN